MKKSRFTTEPIIAILQEHAAGAEAAELIRRYGISRATLYHQPPDCLLDNGVLAGGPSAALLTSSFSTIIKAHHVQH